MGNHLCCQRRTKQQLTFAVEEPEPKEEDQSAAEPIVAQEQQSRRKTISFMEPEALEVPRKRSASKPEAIFESIREVGAEEFYRVLSRSCELFEDLFLHHQDVRAMTAFDLGSFKRILGCKFFLLSGGTHKNPQSYFEGQTLEVLKPRGGWPQKAIPVCLLLSQENHRYILKGQLRDGRLHGKNIVQVTVKDSRNIMGYVIQIYRNHFKWNSKLAIQQEWISDDIGCRVIEKYKPQVGYGSRLEIFYKPNQFDADSEEEEEGTPPGATGANEPAAAEDALKLKVWRSFLMTNLFLRDVEKNMYTRLIINRDFAQNQTKTLGTKNGDVRRDKDGIVEFKTYSLDEIKKRPAVQQTKYFCLELGGVTTFDMINGKVVFQLDPDDQML